MWPRCKDVFTPLNQQYGLYSGRSSRFSSWKTGLSGNPLVRSQTNWRIYLDYFLDNYLFKFLTFASAPPWLLFPWAMQRNFCGRSTLLKIYDILSWGYVLMKWWRPYESCQESCFDVNVRRHSGSRSRIGSLNGTVVRHTSLPSQINNNRSQEEVYYLF